MEKGETKRRRHEDVMSFFSLRVRTRVKSILSTLVISLVLVPRTRTRVKSILIAH